MHPTSVIVLALSALSMAAPVADPEAAPVALPMAKAEAEAISSPLDSSAEIFARSGKNKACCPRGKTSGCYAYDSSENCPANQPTEYSQCSDLGQLGLVNLLLCNVLNGNTINIPIVVSLLNN